MANELKVLIVPSGIETTESCLDFLLGVVLIVPSGIETVKPVSLREKAILVLIVPSGIETMGNYQRNVGNYVLIVPSGIETHAAPHNQRGLVEY